MNLFDSLLYLINEMSPYILLGFMIAGIMHAFIPQQTMSRHLAHGGWKAALKAALIGIPLPLCSCGVLPTAISMHRRGASKAATTSFLIATPQTGMDSIAATWSMLGPAFAAIRPVAALVTSLMGGIAVGHIENVQAADVAVDDNSSAIRKSFLRKCADALRYGYIDLVGSIGGWLVTGLLIAAVITVYVPSDFFAAFGSAPLVSMLAVLVVAVPMYVCATGSIPIALSLMVKGLSPGTALVLLMAGPAVNFASFTLISREMGRRTALLYLATIVAGALLTGIIIDYMLPPDWFAVGDPAMAGAHCCHQKLFPTVCSGILSILLVVALIRNKFVKHQTFTNMTKNYTVKGMNCPHCQATVVKTISAITGVTGVDVNLTTGHTVVEGDHNEDELRNAVRAAGFDIE